MAVPVRTKLSKIRGGILIFLPCFLFAATGLELSLSGSATDNLYFLNQSEAGSILNLNGLFYHQSFIGLAYNTNFSSVNLNSDLIFDNFIELNKMIYLPGVGNRNILFANFYSFLPKNYEIYQLFEIGTGDSLTYYLFNRFDYHLGIQLNYRNFHSDSIKDYLEPIVKSSIVIPMPSFFLKPGIALGDKIYNQENLLFYEPTLALEFPLNFDFAFDLTFAYYQSSSPKSSWVVPVSYIDDLMFELENLNKKKLLGASVIWASTLVDIDLEVNVFAKDFFIWQDKTRHDQGINCSIKLTKTILSNFSITGQYELLYNSSNLADFRYWKNTISLTLEFGLSKD